MKYRKSKISLSTIVNDEDAKPFLYYIHWNNGNIKVFMSRPPLLVTNRIWQWMWVGFYKDRKLDKGSVHMLLEMRQFVRMWILILSFYLFISKRKEARNTECNFHSQDEKANQKLNKYHWNPNSESILFSRFFLCWPILPFSHSKNVKVPNPRRWYKNPQENNTYMI